MRNKNEDDDEYKAFVPGTFLILGSDSHLSWHMPAAHRLPRAGLGYFISPWKM